MSHVARITLGILIVIALVVIANQSPIAKSILVGLGAGEVALIVTAGRRR